MKEYICIDIGGTSVKYGIINEKEQFRRTGECPTEAYLGGPHIMKKVTELIKGLMKECSPEGICVSTGSACDSKNTQISHVLKAIGLQEDYAKGTIRISLGKYNTIEDVDTIANVLVGILTKRYDPVRCK